MFNSSSTGWGSSVVGPTPPCPDPSLDGTSGKGPTVPVSEGKGEGRGGSPFPPQRSPLGERSGWTFAAYRDPKGRKKSVKTNVNSFLNSFLDFVTPATRVPRPPRPLSTSRLTRDGTGEGCPTQGRRTRVSPCVGYKGSTGGIWSHGLCVVCLGSVTVEAICWYVWHTTSVSRINTVFHI